MQCIWLNKHEQYVDDMHIYFLHVHPFFIQIYLMQVIFASTICNDDS